MTKQETIIGIAIIIIALLAGCGLTYLLFKGLWTVILWLIGVMV